VRFRAQRAHRRRVVGPPLDHDPVPLRDALPASIVDAGGRRGGEREEQDHMGHY